MRTLSTRVSQVTGPPLGSPAMGVRGASAAYAVAMAAAVGLALGVCGTLGSALVQTAADPAYLGRVTSVVMLASVGLAPLSYPVVGAAVGAWGAVPVFAGCGAFGSLGVVVALGCGVVRRSELPRPLKA